MKHRILTCKNHPELRWSTKDIAWTTNKDGSGYYNGCRSIFFNGTPTGEGMYHDGSGLHCTGLKDGKVYVECSCPPSDLILAPEDKDVK